MFTTKYTWKTLSIRKYLLIKIILFWKFNMKSLNLHQFGINLLISF